jgi:hypothetical protein
MTIPDQTREYAGRHWETGSLVNALAHRGARAPHTGQPYSEALLLGISGGIALGYFIFEYQGYLPHLALLTRNTFDPLETLFDRLALPREVRQTTRPEQGHANLVAALDAGHAPLVWADEASLPYTGLSPASDYWAMRPIVVVGHEGDDVWVADRARRSFALSAEALSQARGRVKQDRYRLITVEPPDAARLPGAVQKGLFQCASLYTEAPPKGARHNFGLAAFERWATMLTHPRHKQSWARVFPPGPALFQALAGAPHQPGLYGWIMTLGAGPDAERGVFAGCLDEAALLLNRPALQGAAERFRQSASAWRALALAALPDDVPLLREAREVIDRRHARYVNDGPAALPEIQALTGQWNALAAQAAEAFPLDAAQAAALLANLSQHVLTIAALEREAVEALQHALE